MSRSFFALLLVPPGLFAQDLKPVALPGRRPAEASPLMQPSRNGNRTREFTTEKLSPQVALELFVGRLGNQPRGRPPNGALGVEPAGIRDLCGDGGWRFTSTTPRQLPQAGGAGDLRKLTGTVAYVAEAPLNLVYVADSRKWGMGTRIKETSRPTPMPGLSLRTYTCSALPKASMRECAGRCPVPS